MIQNMFFTGEKLIMTSFSNHFPMYEDCDGVTRHEVLEPMVALVVTVVSQGFDELVYGLY
jgi:hypothetical protein